MELDKKDVRWEMEPRASSIPHGTYLSDGTLGMPWEVSCSPPAPSGEWLPLGRVQKELKEFRLKASGRSLGAGILPPPQTGLRRSGR